MPEFVCGRDLSSLGPGAGGPHPLTITRVSCTHGQRVVSTVRCDRCGSVVYDHAAMYGEPCSCRRVLYDVFARYSPAVVRALLIEWEAAAVAERVDNG